MPDQTWVFSGFSEPRYTLIPDIFFDEIMVHLSEAELKVLLYIFRRTFGFKKESDTISLRQMVEGITTRDGRILDHGAGIAKSSVWRGIKGLIAKNIIETVRNSSTTRGDEATTYRLVFRDPVFQSETPPVSQKNTPRVSQRNTQETGLQETEEQGRNLSKDTPCGQLVDNSVDNFAPAVAPIPQIAAIITDFSKEMNDYDHTASNITQATRLYHQTGIALDTYFRVLYIARTKTRKVTGIGKRMAYFFEVLREELRPQEGGSPRAGAHRAQGSDNTNQGTNGSSITDRRTDYPEVATQDRKQR